MDKDGESMDYSLTLPECVGKILYTLHRRGYKAYAVGGCVRDSVMGKTPSDWDICTSALPEETLEALGAHNIIQNGLRHGTVTVRMNGENYEITTFRTDGQYLDNRHPEKVSFVRELKEDLSRRDFTMNAMAYNEEEGLIDPFGGIGDIASGIIRCVGEAALRFGEDALRILRALRFASRLGFSIEPHTAAAIHECSGLLNNISAERIMSEFTGILMGEHCEKILMDFHDVIGVFIPEILPMKGFCQRNPHHIYDVWEHTVKVTAFSPRERILRLSAFFHDIGKPLTFTIDNNCIGHFHGHPEISADMSERILRRLKTDNDTISQVRLLIKLHDLRPPVSDRNVRRLLSMTGRERFFSLMELKRADALAQNPAMRFEKLRYIDELEAACRRQLEAGAAFDMKGLAINGGDIKALGVNEGRAVGDILRRLLDEVIDGSLKNERSELLCEAEKIIHNS